jgi:hypothetical protein
LVYLYLRFIMGEIRTPIWPFVLVSLGVWFGGTFLKIRYQDYRPKFH